MRRKSPRMKFVEEGDDSGSPSSPMQKLKPRRLDNDLLESDETDEDEEDMRKRRENTMGEPHTNSRGKRRSRMPVNSHEELKNIGSSPDSLEGGTVAGVKVSEGS